MSLRPVAELPATTTTEVTPSLRASVAPTTQNTEDVSKLRVAGRYLGERLLGRGGMASVYAVRDVSTGRRLALKRLAHDANRKALILFEREYHTLASLRHPNIVEVYEYGSDADGPYYTMELLEGTDLQYLAPRPWREVCHWLRDVASTLGPLHARRMFHRDLTARNLWLTPGGQIKLIDFGAVAPFGIAGDVVGTPPFVPPEALHGRTLDQRADLYALGALGYWLLTGVHAYPAARLMDLPALWALPQPRVAQQCRALRGAAEPPIPPELDALLAALMSHDPNARPASTAELIDKIDAIAGFEGGETGTHAVAYFGSTKLVGRELESARFLAHLAGDRAVSLCYEAERGIGKTRLLHELTLQARLQRAVVLHVDAASHVGRYGVVQSLAFKLLEAFPEKARTLARQHASTLGHLSPALREALDLGQVTLGSMPPTFAEARVAMQTRLCQWFFDVTHGERIVIAVDDLQMVDDASAAALLALIRHPAQSPLVLLTALRTGQGLELPPASTALLQATQRLVLEALAPSETLELLCSAFGDVPNLARLANRLHRLSRGNPKHCIDLVEHLLHANVIGYADGAWVLPADLDAADLPKSGELTLGAALNRLPDHARTLAQLLSIRAEPTSLEWCSVLSEVTGPDLFDPLDILVSERVLTGSPDGYRFCDESVREQLRAEIEPRRARRAHRKLGKLLLANEVLTTSERLNAGVHLLKGGSRKGPPITARSALSLGLRELDELGASVPALEEAARLFQARGSSPREEVAILAPLTIAGLYCDRRLAARYAGRALAAFDAVLKLSLARKLRPLLGRFLSSYIALSWAFLGCLVRSRARAEPSFREVIELFLMSMSALTGVCTICIDPKGAATYAGMLEPLAVLGKSHVLTFIHEFCVSLVATVQDTPALAYARWQGLIERLQRPQDIRGFPMHYHVQYLSGALYAFGVLQSYRDSTRVLELADQLEQLETPFAQMSADKLRMLYHANQGDLALHQHFRERVEMHAIQQGSAWQVEVWAPGASIMVYLRTHDAMGMKREMEQLQRLSKDVPSLELYNQRARGTYLLLGGRVAEAVEPLEACTRETPQAVAGWARAHGALARAYNSLGRHQEALDICQAVLTRIAADDLMFTSMNLIVQTEFALAEAGLGRVDSAARKLDALLALHAPQGGPLTLGLIHEARARVARLAHDQAAQNLHFERMEKWYRDTSVPALIAYCETLRRDYPDGVEARPRGQEIDSDAVSDGITIQEGRPGKNEQSGGGRSGSTA